jgi:gliding motility-associated-like protein
MKYFISLLCLYCCLTLPATAQLCSGSPGDPIINQTFGSGRGFVMPPNSTTFKNTGGCPAKGQFVISNFIFGCGNNNDKSWIAMIGDHTRDYNGNYMLVNAEDSPGTVYIDTAKNLCENTNYVFSAWISNAMQTITCGGKAVPASLIMTIKKLDGTVLASTNTGDILIENDRVWKEYGTSFICPPNTPSVIVSITAIPKPGCGSGFVVDDITFRSCGPSVSITLDGSTTSGNVCADYTAPFILQGAYSPGFTDPQLQWQNSFDSGKTWIDIPGANVITYAIPRRVSGIINYRMIIAERAYFSSLNCRIASNSIYTEIHPVPPHNPPQNFLGCLDKDLIMPETSPFALSILWNGPNGYSSAKTDAVVPSVTYADTGLYTLKQNYYFGCTTNDSFYLKIYPSTTITATPALPVCQGVSQQLNVSASGGGTFKWFPSTGLSRDNIPNPIATPADSTIYKIIVTNTYGCADSAFINVPVYKNLEVDAGPDKVILIGDTATLNATIKGTGVRYTWAPNSYISNINSTDPLVFPPQSLEYTISAVSTVGCGSSFDNVWVKVYNELKIPNAFTPNGDGKNDLFRVLPLDNYTLVNFNVYNRFGDLVFRTSDIQKGWDGTLKGVLQPPGVYVYQVDMINVQGKRLFKKGSVSLIR